VVLAAAHPGGGVTVNALLKEKKDVVV